MGMTKGVASNAAAAAYEIIALRNSIEEFNKQASKQTQQMLRLTHVIAWLTGVMLLGVIVQICLVINH
jgi:uncharacterized protein with von Willebrand factor type A (vWA) domain